MSGEIEAMREGMVKEIEVMRKEIGASPEHEELFRLLVKELEGIRHQLMRVATALEGVEGLVEEGFDDLAAPTR